LITGPLAANICKNNIENALAITKLGMYMIVLKKPVPFIFNLVDVNHKAKSNEIINCGMKPINHIISVLPAYLNKTPSEKILI
jgi:hypothetical protein